MKKRAITFLACLVIGIVVALGFDFTLHLNAQRQRAKLFEKQAQMMEEMKMTRGMLNARAEIQIILYRAVRDGRKLTAEEDRRIKELWGSAEYGFVSPEK